MTDRDTFAAAALTGLLHGIPEGADIAACAADAYKIADAMLRERGRTTHDAVPEARAHSPSPDHAGHRDATTGEPGGGAGTGDICERLRACETRPLTTMSEECRAVTRDPAAWVELWKTLQDARVEIERLRNGAPSGCETVQRKPVVWARFYPNGGPMSVFLDRPPADAEPLYRSPTLTDEEREAIYRAEARLRTAYVPDDETAAVLRALLKRLA
jgi:hypothetical protein